MSALGVVALVGNVDVSAGRARPVDQVEVRSQTSHGAVHGGGRRTNTVDLHSKCYLLGFLPRQMVGTAFFVRIVIETNWIKITKRV